MISKQAIADYFARPLRDFRWLKEVPEAELDLELRELVPQQFKTTPWRHQKVCYLIGTILKRFLFIVDMGGGKTKIALDLFAYRQHRKEVNRLLVVVPRLVNIGAWAEEIPLHSNFPHQSVTGSIEQKRHALTNPTADVVIIDLAGLMLALTTKEERRDKKKRIVKKLIIDEVAVAKVASKFQFVVYDEIHKIKNHDSIHARIATRLCRLVECTYGMTGTVFGRSPEEVWSQFKAIDRGETFGNTLGLFREAFFTEVSARFEAEYKFNRKLDAQFNTMLQNRSIRYRESELMQLPPLRYIQHPVQLPDAQRKHYALALKGYLEAQGVSRAMDAKFIRMRQITSGHLSFTDDETGETIRTVFPDNPKLELLLGLLEDSDAGEKFLVFTDYTDTGRIIDDALTKHKIVHRWLHGGSKDPLKLVEEYRLDPKVRVLIANSESGSTGLNLQMTKHVVFFESPCSPITRKQAEKRAHRQGVKGNVLVHDFVVARSVDCRILDNIKTGKSLYTALVEDQKYWTNLLTGAK